MRPRVLLVLTVVLAGCGGGGLSTEDYRAEAKRICEESKRQTEAVEEPTRATSAAISDFFKQLLAANENATKRFKALEPPDDLRKAHEAAVAASDAGDAETRKLIASLEDGGDPRQILTAARPRLQALAGRQVEAAKDLGVPACVD